jgi:hypothetical protein
MRPSPILLFFCFLLSACAQQGNNADRLANAYADVLRYRDSSIRADSSVVRSGTDSIFAVYDISRDKFLHGVRALADDPETYQSFFAGVDSRLSATSGLPMGSPSDTTK